MSMKLHSVLATWICIIFGLNGGTAFRCKGCKCCIREACWKDEYCIYGCQDGYYGNKCYNTCPDSCSRKCDRNQAVFRDDKNSESKTFFCETCPPGKYRGGNSITVNCMLPCPENCKTCTMADDIVTCGECKESYYESKCASVCPTNCVNCTNATHCDTCKYEYYNRNGITNCSFYCPENCYCWQSSKCNSCKDGYYDTQNNCSDICPETCRRCLDKNECTVCKNRYFGTLCQSKCSVGCSTETCEKDTGNCTCRSLFTGQTCDQCIEGHFGAECNRRCKTHKCKYNMCNRHNGTCIECNSKNIVGELCEKCIVGMHGENCELNCPENCKDNICVKLNGTCISGCKGDFDGHQCDKCKIGKYGVNCTISCPVNCLDNDCDHRGYCRDCPKNMNGTECNDCKAGYFGDNCLEKCARRCKDKICERNTGSCTACENGLYGTLCDRNCSSNCLEKICNFHNGTCSKGCSGPSSGDMCCINGSNCMSCSSNTECQTCTTGFHGDDCGKNCSGNCKLFACEKVSGYCSLGCISGFQGPTCSDSQSKGTLELVVGVGGLAFAVIAVVVFVTVFMVKRRAQHPRKPPNSGTNILSTDRNETEEKATKQDAHHRFSKPDEETCSDLNRVSATLEDQLEEQLEQDTEEILTDVACSPKDTYYNYTPKVKGARLYDYVMQKPYKDYQQEFQLLPKGIQKPCTVARQPENVVKNRYAAVYAYDASRVQVKSEPTFYINACYVDGYKTEKAYIASLGPTLKATENFVTFWKMVWNEKSDVIVMLTNLEESSGMKCEQYWPEEGEESAFGDVTVSCQGEDLYATYTVRTFYIEKDAARRKVTHFHFTAWPDKRVPESIITLVEFWLRVRLLAEGTSGPVIVHCSAGVGRTGTYIALDRLTTEGRAEGSVNIFGCVLDMREQRVNMVQTADQYVYLHKCLAYTLTFDSDAIQSDSFRQYVELASDSNFQTQFTELQRKIEDTDKEEDEARDINQAHKTKNRKSADVPGNRKRPRLHFNRNFNDSDYINASYVDGFKRRNSYILAQSPLPATVEDFLCLLFQENCICIVSLDGADMKSKDIGMYLPADNQTLTVGSFTVTSSKCERKQDYVSKTLTIQCSTTSKGDKKTVHYFQYTNWKESSDSPEDAGSFVQLVKDVEMKAITNSADTGKPTLVHCLTGARRSGVFCVVAILLEKLQTERQASVVNTVRQVRAGRKSAIHNLEQLEFCYRCAAAYTDLFSTYSNFTA